MAAEETINARIQASGFTLITMAEAAPALAASLGAAGPAVQMLLLVDWSRFLGLLPAVPMALSAFAPSHSAAAAAAIPAVESEMGRALSRLPPAARQPHVEAAVLSVLEDLTGAGGLTADTPLMEAGIDSLGATEAVSRLREATGAALAPTLIFDQPSARAIATHVVGRLVGAEAAAAAPSTA